MTLKLYLVYVGYDVELIRRIYAGYDVELMRCVY